jgi:hypothetical protein
VVTARATICLKLDRTALVDALLNASDS